MDYELQLDEYGRTTFASNGVAQTCYALNDAGGATNETRATDNAIDTISRTFDVAERLIGLAMLEQGYGQDLFYSTNGLLVSISNSDAVVAYNYSPDFKDVGYTMAFADGGTFASVAVRDPYRRDLVLSVAMASCSSRSSPLDESIRLSLSSTFFGVMPSLSARTTDESFTSFSAMMPYIMSPMKRAAGLWKWGEILPEKYGEPP